MPANSGAITGTIAHKHSSDSADGGFLDDGVTGVTGTTNGSLLYFDNSSIAQNLGIGGAGTVLTSSGSVPAWSSGGSKALIGSTLLGSTQNTIGLSFSAIAQTDFSYLQCVLNCKKSGNSAQINFQVNGYGSSDYTSVLSDNYYTTNTVSNLYGSHIPINLGSRGQSVFATVNIVSNAVDNKPLVYFESVTEDRNQTSGSGCYYAGGVTSFNEVEFQTSPQDFLSGSRLDVYRVNV